VGDASILPEIPSVPTNVTTIMVAERPDRVVVASPALDDDLGLAQGVEDLKVSLGRW
jgi:choline dehydrogenase-like flavoprotein